MCFSETELNEILDTLQSIKLQTDRFYIVAVENEEVKFIKTIFFKK